MRRQVSQHFFGVAAAVNSEKNFHFVGSVIKVAVYASAGRPGRKGLRSILKPGIKPLSELGKNRFRLEFIEDFVIQRLKTVGAHQLLGRRCRKGPTTSRVDQFVSPGVEQQGGNLPAWSQRHRRGSSVGDKACQPT